MSIQYSKVQQAGSLDGALADAFGFALAGAASCSSTDEDAEDYIVLGANHAYSDGAGAAYIFKSVGYNSESWSNEYNITTDNNLNVTGTTYDSSRFDGYRVWTQLAKLLPVDAATIGAAKFGSAVSMDDNNTVIVGAYGNVATTGFAYIFSADNDIWSQQVKLTPSDGIAADYFGYAVAVKHNVAMVSAPSHNSRDGCVYVFEQNNIGTWSQQAKLSLNSSYSDPSFALKIDFSSDSNSAIMSSTAIDSGEGATFVFSSDVDSISGSRTWSQTAKLTAPNAALLDYFGSAQAIYGNTIVVGAKKKDTTYGLDSGAAYVFINDGSLTNGGWTLKSEIYASDASKYDSFGSSLSLCGDRKLVVSNAYGTTYMYALQGNDTDFTDQSPVMLPTSSPIGDYYEQYSWKELQKISASSDYSSAYNIAFTTKLVRNGNDLIVGSESQDSVGYFTYYKDYVDQVPPVITLPVPSTILLVFSLFIGALMGYFYYLSLKYARKQISSTEALPSNNSDNRRDNAFTDIALSSSSLSRSDSALSSVSDASTSSTTSNGPRKLHNFSTYQYVLLAVSLVVTVLTLLFMYEMVLFQQYKVVHAVIAMGCITIVLPAVVIIIDLNYGKYFGRSFTLLTRKYLIGISKNDVDRGLYESMVVFGLVITVFSSMDNLRFLPWNNTTYAGMHNGYPSSPIHSICVVTTIIQLLCLIAIQLVCLSQPVAYGYYYQAGNSYIFESDYSRNGAWIVVLNVLLLFGRLVVLLVSEWEIVFTFLFSVCGATYHLLGMLYTAVCGKKPDYYDDSNDDIEFLNKNTIRSDDFTSITVDDHDKDPSARKSRRHRRKDNAEVSVRRVNSPKTQLKGYNNINSAESSIEQTSVLIASSSATPAYPGGMNSDIKDMNYYRQKRAERASPDTLKEVSNVEEFVSDAHNLPSPSSRSVQRYDDDNSSSDEEVTASLQIPNVRINVKRSTRK